MELEITRAIREEDMETFNLKMSNYEDPMEALLDLIKANKMDIENIELSILTDQYLKMMEDISAIDMEKASKFIEMAATLIEIKSKALLPKHDEETEEYIDEAALLAQRLKLYSLFKEQCEVLLDKLLPFAENQMKKYREFYPFAAVILMDDTVELTGSFDGNEHPESKDVINDLIQIHMQLASEGKIKASGIAWNASVASADGKPTDAIIVSLEHKDDYSVIVGEPYKVGLFKKVNFGNLFAMEGKHDIF